MRNHSNWSNEFNNEGFENTNKSDEILNDAYEALTRFYQKENKRSKTAKQKKHCWN